MVVFAWSDLLHHIADYVTVRCCAAKTTATGRLSLWSGRAVRAVMDWTIVQAERVCVCQEVLECNRIQTE